MEEVSERRGRRVRFCFLLTFFFFFFSAGPCDFESIFFRNVLLRQEEGGVFFF